MLSPARRIASALCLTFAVPTFASEPPAPLDCGAPSSKTSSSDRGDPRIRSAAQRGLNFMASQSRVWTSRNPGCYGCHVHSVTLEGLTIGRRNSYDVSPADMDLMMKAMLNDTQGVHATTFVTARAFGGVAFARYDQFIDGKRTDDLLRVGRKLMESQLEDGSVKVDDTRFPIESGVMQATFQAMQTWRQAYARTADTVWLQPLRKAEGYLQRRAKDLSHEPAQLQDAAYALMGLTAAGVAPTEAASRQVQKLLTSVQHDDGGWGFRPGASDAFATGQVVYALRNAGMTEMDTPVARGMSWLLDHQQKDGGWGGAVSTSNGSQIGEAMWAVLGLVSVDVTSIAVAGITDGQHVAPAMQLDVTAKDNQVGGIAKLAVLVDDLPLRAECGGHLALAWDTSSLKDGRHVVEIVATNAKGNRSRRRFEVYAGNTFLTDVGARFDEAAQRTEISLRDIAPEGQAGKVRLDVFAVDATKGAPVAGKRLFSADRATQSGAMTFEWTGKDDGGKAQPRGRYLAQVSFVSAEGKVVQKEEVLFFHDSEAVQHQQFGEVQGNLSMKGGAGSSNTTVELVDDEGRVVQTTRSTEQGNYRFKNVDQGKYKVRVQKDGFSKREMPVEAKPAAAPAQADAVME